MSLTTGTTFETLLQNHFACVGITGSGKTYLSKWMHQNTVRRSIFVNTQEEDGVVGHYMTEWDPRVLSEHEKLNLVPPDDPDEANAMLEQMRRDLFVIGKSVNTHRGRIPRWCVVWWDEIQEHAWEGTRHSPAHSLIKRGRRHGITVVPISQSPADVSKGVLKQCNVHLIFRLGRFEGGYLKTYNLPDATLDLKGHQFVVVTPETVEGPYVL